MLNLKVRDVRDRFCRISPFPPFLGWLMDFPWKIQIKNFKVLELTQMLWLITLELIVMVSNWRLSSLICADSKIKLNAHDYSLTQLFIYLPRNLSSNFRWLLLVCRNIPSWPLQEPMKPSHPLITTNIWKGLVIWTSISWIHNRPTFHLILLFSSCPNPDFCRCWFD